MKALSFNRKALLANLVIWSLFISISLLASLIDSSRAGVEVNELNRIYAYLISFGPWMLVTPIFYWILELQHQRKKRSLALVSAAILLAWSPFVVFFETFSFTLMRPTDDIPFLQLAANLPLFYWVYCLLLYGVVLGACLALIYYRRFNENRLIALRTEQANVELKLQLSELQIQSLLSQLEPHFLFNALNAIASLVRIADKKQALTAITRLSDLLRYALDASNQKFVSFDQELDFVRDYLSLQQLRFEEKLVVQLNDQRQQKNQECPPFLLQIFVENAIKHGLEKSGDTMHLSITISDIVNPTNSRLNLLIENSKINIDKESKGLGIGLNNLSARLKILYHDAVEIFTDDSSDRFRVEVSLPTTAKI